jgi:hypothetical protein
MFHHEHHRPEAKTSRVAQVHVPFRIRDCVGTRRNSDPIVESRFVSLSFRHRNRHSLACPAFGNPYHVAGGLDCGWCLESFLNYRDAALISIDGNDGDLAAPILK